MKFTFISRNGDILPLAQRIEAEGNEVTFYVVRDEELISENQIIDGGPDVIIIDSPGFGRMANRFKKLGFPVIGGSLLADTIKSDSTYHTKFLKACGLHTNEVEKLQNSIAIDIEGWFNGKDFISVLYTINNITFPGNKSDELYKESIAHLVTPLKRNGYTGPISIKSNVNSVNIQFDSVKPHFTTATMLSMLEGIKSGISNTINQIANGSNRWVVFKPGYFIAIQLVLNPELLLEPDKYHDTHVYGLLPENLKHMWVYGLKKNGNGYVYNGIDGRFGVVTARGDSISEVRRRANRTIEGKTVVDGSGNRIKHGGLNVDGMLYLKGVGNKADYQHGRLKEWKWIS